MSPSLFPVSIVAVFAEESIIIFFMFCKSTTSEPFAPPRPFAIELCLNQGKIIWGIQTSWWRRHLLHHSALRCVSCWKQRVEWFLTHLQLTLDKWLRWGRKWSVDCLSTWHISLQTNEGRGRGLTGSPCWGISRVTGKDRSDASRCKVAS